MQCYNVIQCYPENPDEREEVDVSLISCAVTRRAAGAAGVARTVGRWWGQTVGAVAARNKQSEAGREDRPGACANCVAGPLDKTVEGVAALALEARNKSRWSLKTGRVHARTRYTW